MYRWDHCIIYMYARTMWNHRQVDVAELLGESRSQAEAKEASIAELQGSGAWHVFSQHQNCVQHYNKWLCFHDTVSCFVGRPAIACDKMFIGKISTLNERVLERETEANVLKEHLAKVTEDVNVKSNRVEQLEGKCIFISIFLRLFIVFRTIFVIQCCHCVAWFC